jgi:hypothetical protein
MRMTRSSPLVAELDKDGAAEAAADGTEVSGITLVPIDDVVGWDLELEEPPAMTSYTPVELRERRKKLRKIVGTVMTGATMLLALAGSRVKTRTHQTKISSETSSQGPPSRSLPQPPAKTEK